MVRRVQARSVRLLWPLSSVCGGEGRAQPRQSLQERLCSAQEQIWMVQLLVPAAAVQHPW